MPLKVLHAAAVGDNAQWMVDQLKKLRERGHTVEALISSEGRCSAALRQENIPYTLADLDLIWKSADYLRIFKKVFKLAAFLRAKKFDVVHYHLFTSSILVRLAAWMADVPARVRMVPETFYLEAASPARLEFGTCWMDSRIIPTCRYTQDLYLKAGAAFKKKLSLLYYGADPERFDPSRLDRQSIRRRLCAETGIATDSPLVGMVAYFIPPFEKSEWVPEHLWGESVKSHETLIAAIPDILKAMPAAKFLLIGEGAGAAGAKYLESLKEKAQALGLGHAVVFTGFRSNVPELLAALDVVVQCSVTENLGGTIEALLMEKAVVATRVGGLVDSIIDKHTGLLVNPKDPPGLSSAICQLLQDRQLARTLASNGRRFALQQLSLSGTVAGLEQIYGQCTQDRPGLASRAGGSGYRWWLMPIRSAAGAAVAAWAGWICCRAEFKNRAHWLKANTARRAYLTGKRSADVVLSLCGIALLCCLAPAAVAASLASSAGKSSLPADMRSLWKVLIGEMTLVGLILPDRQAAQPAPIKRGLTGWAHLNDAPGTTPAQLQSYDNLYRSTASPILDLKILGKSLLLRLKRGLL